MPHGCQGIDTHSMLHGHQGIATHIMLNSRQGIDTHSMLHGRQGIDTHSMLHGRQGIDTHSMLHGRQGIDTHSMLHGRQSIDTRSMLHGRQGIDTQYAPRFCCVLFCSYYTLYRILVDRLSIFFRITPLTLGGDRTTCIDLVSVKLPTIHLYHIPQCTIQNRNVHISVVNGALWEQMHCWICEIDLLLLGTIDLYLTHWGRVAYLCVDKLTITGSDNGMSPGRHQAIIWTNAGMLLIGSLGTNFSEIPIIIQTFLFKRMHFKMSSEKWRPFCLGLNVLTTPKHAEARTAIAIIRMHNRDVIV